MAKGALTIGPCGGANEKNRPRLFIYCAVVFNARKRSEVSESHRLNNGSIAKANEKGTVYVVSVSGPKAYALNPKYRDLTEKTGEQVQLFQVLSIDGGRLSYKSYTVTGRLFDSFVPTKWKERGRAWIIQYWQLRRDHAPPGACLAASKLNLPDLTPFSDPQEKSTDDQHRSGPRQG